VLWWLRWGAASTWISGVLYASLLAAQDDRGLLGWFHGPLRGQWVSLGFVLSTVMVFHVWFVAWPAQARLIAEARRGNDFPESSDRSRPARFSNRLATYLSVPLLIAMQAGRHGGELTGVLPVDFLPAAGVVLVAGLVIAALISHIVAPLAGR
jgi:uncharacterized membrane protein